MFKNIVITGSTGFIGRNLVERLKKEQVKIFLLVRDINPEIKADNIIQFKYDTIEDLINYFNEKSIDLIIHLASLYLKEHDSNQVDNLIESNLLLGTRLLEAASESKVKAFVNTGTFWQHYENRDYSPVNLYAATKQSFEDIARYYSEVKKLYFVTLKLNDTFGPGDIRKKIFNIWKELGPGDCMKMSPGDQLIDILYIDDVIEGYIKLIEHIFIDLERRKNCSMSFAMHNKDIVSLKELSILFREVSGKFLNIDWGGYNYKDREVMTPWIHGLEIPGWKQKIDLRDGIKKFLNREG